MKKAIALRLAAIPAFVMATMGAAHAAIDTAAGEAAVTDMTTAAGKVLGALLLLAIAIWSGRKIAHFFGSR